MKIFVRVIQVLVAVLFIISGVVKANDPLGLSYKMQEFFELWTTGLREGHFFAKHFFISFFDFLHDHSLFLSVLMITLEIITGLALLIGWMKKFILWLLLVLIIFFSFLTGYAYLSGKFSNCGCFGDCLPITPLSSFLKDIVLLVMICSLLIGQKYIQPIFTKRFRSFTIIAGLVFSLVLQWYVLNYLPLVDCLPLKKGNNIAEQTKAPKNSTPSIYETRLVYKNLKTNVIKDMSQDEFNNSKIWEDPDWKWQETKTTLVKKGNDDPPLKGFSLIGEERTDSNGTVFSSDSTQFILNLPVAIIGFGFAEQNNTGWLNDFKQVVAAAKQKNLPVYFASNEKEKFKQLFAQNKIDVSVFSCDYTVIRIAARTNPALYILRSGTIQNKYSYHHFKNAADDLKKL